MKFALIKERKNPPDRRVVFTPEAAKKLTEKHKQFHIKVETSNIRAFADADYSSLGLEVTKDVTDCDVMLGVKEVPIEALIPNKKYFFFSHTIKKQPYNRKLLQAILEKDIELYDHEVITKENGARLVAFGRYAGIVGAYNGFRAYSLKYDLYNLPKAETLKDQQELIAELNKVKLPNIKILLTGRGRVAGGAREMIEAMHIKKVTINEYITETFNEPVFCQIEVQDYNKRKDGERFTKQDFYENPTEYESNFMRFANVTDFYISGHFFGDGSPYLFTREDAKLPEFKIKVVADVSCDIDGPVACTIRPSTIAEPIYGYHPVKEKEVSFKDNDAIAVMAVDNLPCELPRDASVGFGEQFAKYVIPSFFNGDKDGVLERARMTRNGKLTKRYSYLQDYIDGKE